MARRRPRLLPEDHHPVGELGADGQHEAFGEAVRSKNNRSTSRLSRSATAKNTASCTSVGVRLDQQVHRPIRLILVHPCQPGDSDVIDGPLGGGQLGLRVDRPVRHECEQHPLHSVVNRRPPRTLRSAASTSRPFHSPSSSHAAPAGGRDRRSPRSARRRRPPPQHRCGRVGFTEVAVDRADQPAHPVPVQPVLAAQVQQHLRLRHAADALVVGRGPSMCPSTAEPGFRGGRDWLWLSCRLSSIAWTRFVPCWPGADITEVAATIGAWRCSSASSFRSAPYSLFRPRSPAPCCWPAGCWALHSSGAGPSS